MGLKGLTTINVDYKLITGAEAIPNLDEAQVGQVTDEGLVGKGTGLSEFELINTGIRDQVDILMVGGAKVITTGSNVQLLVATKGTTNILFNGLSHDHGGGGEEEGEIGDHYLFVGVGLPGGHDSFVWLLCVYTRPNLEIW